MQYLEPRTPIQIQLAEQIIEVPTRNKPEDVIHALQENRMDTCADRIRYARGQRYHAHWREMNIAKWQTKLPWKERGV